MQRRDTWKLAALGALLLAGCSAPDIEGALWRCASQADCGADYVCAEALGACVRPDNSADGVSSDRIVLGMVAPLSGVAAPEGLAVRDGVQAWLDRVNATGGVDGRQLELRAMDDGGDPAVTLSATRQLAESGEVFAFVGGVGGEAAVDYLVEGKRLLVGSHSGSAALRRDPPDRYVFNIGLGDRDEATALVGHLTGVRAQPVPPSSVALFTEGEGDGVSAWGTASVGAVGGALESLAGRNPADLVVLTHARGTNAVDAAVGDALKWLAGGRTKSDTGEIYAAIVLGSWARPSATFIKALLEELAKIQRGTSGGLEYNLSQAEAEELLNVKEVVFASLSTSETVTMAEELSGFGTYQTVSGERSYCASVIAVQAVPPVQANASGLIAYRDQLAASNAAAKPSFAGFGGYVAARLLVDALRRNGPALSTEGVVQQLESTSLDLGTGEPLTFSPSDRVAFERVWSTALSDGCQHEAFDLGEPPDVIDEPDDGCGPEGCILTGTLTEDITLTANKRWLLRGTVFVGDGTNPTVMTINPGTTVLGDVGTTGVLVIRRGARLIAEGTAEAPIVFTSSNPPGSRGSGDWGGIILNGRAPINGCDAPPCEAFGEGGTGFYGGDDPEDDSGSLRYLRVEFAGKLLSPENELNGLALQGVGRGTKLEYIQIHRGADDGVEFFGGTANIRHLLVTGMEDDSLDWTEGWQGRGQFIVVQQWGESGDNGIEADNNADDRDASPRSRPLLCNLTLIGVPTSSSSDLGMLLREGTGAVISSALVLGWNDACLDIDHPERPAGLDASPSTPSPLSGRRPTGYTLEVAVSPSMTASVEVATCPRGISGHL
jgi:ABC-type branched-subunit amino acid transport system substrate-binding protein